MFNSSEMINEYVTRNSVFVSIQALIGIIGIFCNILAIFVFERKQLKKHSYSFYWRIKAYFDIVILLHTFRRWAKHFLNFDIDLISSFFCRFNPSQPIIATTLVLFIETLITLDRYFLIVCQNRFKLLKKRWFQISLVSFIVIYSLLVNIQLPLNYRLDEIAGGKWICHISNQEWRKNSAIFMLNIMIISFIVNPILDFKIIYFVLTTRNPVMREITQSAITDRKFTISAIVLNINSLMIKLPLFILIFFSAFFGLCKEKTEFIFAICFCLGLIERAEVFFVNVLVNSVFRQEFLSMIRFSKTRIDNEVLMSSNILLRRSRKVPSKPFEN